MFSEESSFAVLSISSGSNSLFNRHRRVSGLRNTCHHANMREKKFQCCLDLPSKEIGTENRSLSLETNKYGSFVSPSNRQ